jgi:heme exporter protein D
MHGTHLGFIVAAYAVTVFVIAAMIASIVLDHRALKRALARLPGRHGENDRP